MIDLSIDGSGMTRLEKSLLAVAGRQIPYAAARALNECARTASVGVNGRMAQTFDRPNAFTSRAVIAPRELAAAAGRLQAVVTVQPTQAKYLLHEEIGGTRDPSENTLRPGASALVMPGRGLLLDQFGGIPRGTISRIKRGLAKVDKKARAKRQAARTKTQQARSKAVKRGDRGFFYVPKAGRGPLPGGFYQRLPGHRIVQLIGFAGEAHYKPRFKYHEQVEADARRTFAAAFRRALIEAARTAR